MLVAVLVGPLLETIVQAVDFEQHPGKCVATTRQDRSTTVARCGHPLPEPLLGLLERYRYPGSVNECVTAVPCLGYLATDTGKFSASVGSLRRTAIVESCFEAAPASLLPLDWLRSERSPPGLGRVGGGLTSAVVHAGRVCSRLRREQAALEAFLRSQWREVLAVTETVQGCTLNLLSPRSKLHGQIYARRCVRPTGLLEQKTARRAANQSNTPPTQAQIRRARRARRRAAQSEARRVLRQQQLAQEVRLS